MLWQDRNGTWYSTVSPIDAKIRDAMIEARSNGTLKVWDESGDSLFQEMFGEFYAD